MKRGRNRCCLPEQTIVSTTERSSRRIPFFFFTRTTRDSIQLGASVCRVSAGMGLPQGFSLQLLGALNCCRRHSSVNSLFGSVSPLNCAVDGANSLFRQRPLTLAYFKEATRAEAAERTASSNKLAHVWYFVTAPW